MKSGNALDLLGDDGSQQKKEEISELTSK